MSLSERLREYVRACFTGIWVQSHEHEDVLLEIGRLCQEEGWPWGVWDVSQGLTIPHLSSETGSPPQGADPLAAIRAAGALSSPESSGLLVLVNFHRFLNSAEIVQDLAHQITSGKQDRTFLVVLSPVVQIPVELEKQFVVIEHELPSRAQLAEIAQGIASEPGELPDGADLERILDSAAGLTRYEAEGAYSLSLVRHGQIQPETLWEIKSQTLKQTGLLTLSRGTESFQTLGGLQSLKNFCQRALRREQHQNPLARPRGVLLLGVPGSGKSAFAKSLGNETGRPTLVLDVGSLMASLVGQTEQQTRQALRIADAMAPCILFVDEVEKGLSGVSAGGAGDSGVSSRMFGTLLTWLSDHESDVFVICTANDVSRLPPEFSRAERFDSIFFLDLPGSAEKQTIWDLYLTQFGLAPKQQRPIDTDWTGAEIRACCRLAALLDISLIDAARHVVPVAVTAHETVERLRTWASGRCLAADKPGIYQREPEQPKRPGRRVSRDPSNN